ncbi:hypothetical protein [Massilia sp. CCM 8734]|uniref:hypothetical protein n=1 Tax=Massilia sp. CCM 8734 TaxID=2609283 RepID=UPI00227726F5|nr:hypothetical protein [Massilia sp. CCM 8734]
MVQLEVEMVQLEVEMVQLEVEMVQLAKETGLQAPALVTVLALEESARASKAVAGLRVMALMALELAPAQLPRLAASRNAALVAGSRRAAGRVGSRETVPPVAARQATAAVGPRNAVGRAPAVVERAPLAPADAAAQSSHAWAVRAASTRVSAKIAAQWEEAKPVARQASGLRQ